MFQNCRDKVSALDCYGISFCKIWFQKHRAKACWIVLKPVSTKYGSRIVGIRCQCLCSCWTVLESVSAKYGSTVIGLKPIGPFWNQFLKIWFQHCSNKISASAGLFWNQCLKIWFHNHRAEAYWTVLEVISEDMVPEL